MDNEEGIQNEPEQTEESTGTDNGGVNYHDRIRAEPDFAVGEIQQKDRYIGELHEKTNKFKPLEQYVDALGSSEALIDKAVLGHRVESDPTLKKLVEDAMNGVTPKPAQVAPEEEDEIYDPEIKAMYSRLTNELEQRDSIISDLQSRLNKTEAEGLMGSVEKNVEDGLSMFEDDTELHEEAKTAIQQAVDQLERAASAGDRSAAQQLDSLGKPQGKQTIKMMTVDIRDKYFEKKLSRSSNQPDGETMRSKATDGRASTRAAPPTDTIAIKPGTRVSSSLMESVLKQVATKKGMDPDKLFH